MYSSSLAEEVEPIFKVEKAARHEDEQIQEVGIDDNKSDE